MVRGLIAGNTSYENQSLENIKIDIIDWIRVSKDVKKQYLSLYKFVRQSDFYNEIPYDYKSFLSILGSIIDANIEDLRLVLDSINNRQITDSRVKLFMRIGEKSTENFNTHKKIFNLDKDKWHEYGDTNFQKIEELYVLVADYFEYLWDVTNAAHRLKNYIDSVNKGGIVANIDNSIKIGDKNKINNTSIGHSLKKLKYTNNSEDSWISSILSGIIATVVGGIILSIILLYFGLSN